MELKKYWAEYIEKVDETLNKPPFNKVFDVLEEKIKVGRKYIATAVAVLLVWLALGLLAPLVVNIVAFTYPAIQSIKSLESQNAEGAHKWLTYWIVYGCFSVSEFFVDFFLSWFPMYFIGKMAFLVWCMAPIDFNGSDVIYRCAILPFFIQHKDKIEKLSDNLGELATEANELAIEAAAGQKKGIFESFKSK